MVEERFPFVSVLFHKEQFSGMTKSLFFYCRRSWEGVDEVSQSKIGMVDGATPMKNIRKRSSIELICTAVRNLSHQHHTTSQPSSPKPIEVKPQTKEMCTVCEGNTNESKLEKVPATAESQERYDNRNMKLSLHARHGLTVLITHKVEP